MGEGIHTLPENVFQLAAKNEWSEVGTQLLLLGYTIKQIKGLAASLALNLANQQESKQAVHNVAPFNGKQFSVDFSILVSVEELAAYAREYHPHEHKNYLCCPHTNKNSVICNPCHQQLSALMLMAQSIPEPQRSWVFTLFLDANPHIKDQGLRFNMIDQSEQKSILFETTWKAIRKFDGNKAGNAAALPRFAQRTLHNELRDHIQRKQSGIDGIQYHQKCKSQVDMVCRNFEQNGIQPTDHEVQMVCSLLYFGYFDVEYIRYLLFGEETDLCNGIPAKNIEAHQVRADQFLIDHFHLSENELVRAVQMAWNKKKAPIDLQMVRMFRNLSCVSMDAPIESLEGQTYAEMVSDVETIEDRMERSWLRNTAKRCVERSFARIDRLCIEHQSALFVMIDAFNALWEEQNPDDLSRYASTPSNEKWYKKIAERVTLESARKHGFQRMKDAQDALMNKEFQSAIYQLFAHHYEN